MSKVNYTGGQVLTDATPGMKKKHFALPTMVFFIYCACAGGAFGIESMISSSGPGLTLLLLVLIPILWAMPIGTVLLGAFQPCSGRRRSLCMVEDGLR